MLHLTQHAATISQRGTFWGSCKSLVSVEGDTRSAEMMITTTCDAVFCFPAFSSSEMSFFQLADFPLASILLEKPYMYLAIVRGQNKAGLYYRDNSVGFCVQRQSRMLRCDNQNTRGHKAKTLHAIRCTSLKYFDAVLYRVQLCQVICM